MSGLRFIIDLDVIAAGCMFLLLVTNAIAELLLERGIRVHYAYSEGLLAHADVLR